MKTFEESGIRLEFPDTAQVRKFDDPQTHGHVRRHTMKAVDFIVERPDEFLFIEVKNIPEFDGRGLGQKFRDSFLYEWADGRADKPIIYKAWRAWPAQQSSCGWSRAVGG